MTKTTLAIGGLLLATTALVAPAAFAQSSPEGSAPPTGGSVPAAGEPQQAATPQDQAAQTQDQVDISTPGGEPQTGDIVVMGRNIPDAIRGSTQVVSVLSSADIARTGEGDIAGALGRVTGLSVVDNRFVYVRGLGERYSLALLNGLPLPSPEPLRRVVPLDIFPTDVVASAVVQKSYSVNYPGEFGGGVINLTTQAVPKESFLEIGGSASGDTFTSSNLGYTYYGSDLDPTGFDDGTRSVPKGFNNALHSGKLVNLGNYDLDTLKGYAASLVNAPTTVLQRNNHIPFNGKADITGGTAFDVGSVRLGVIATAGYSNSWRTREAHEQFSVVGDVSQVAQGGRDFTADITDNRIVVDGLLGIGAEFGQNKIRFTNLFIRDTIKEGRLASGFNSLSNAGIPELDQSTSWFERQLFDSQLVGEFKFGNLSVDLRGTYANAQRRSPYERNFTYFYDDRVGDYINTLNSNQSGTATVSFSDLTDKVYNGGIDLTYKLPTARDFSISAGYNYNYNVRNATRRDFRYLSADGALPIEIAQERPDFLVSDYNVNQYNIYLSDQSGQGGTAAAYKADLRVHAGYVQVDASPIDHVTVQFGARYESGLQKTIPLMITELVPPMQLAPLDNDYWLPAGTLTWNFAENMQFRVSASKTIARPQFREIVDQIYQDTESDRTFQGNQYLTDSTLFNAEARYEWYFGKDQRFTLAGFYKKINHPIETVAFYNGSGIIVSFLNAPKAILYGAETELQKYFNLDSLVGSDSVLATRRIVAIANYTYTQSKLQIGANDQITYFDGNPTLASSQFTDSAPLTGQSDHVANLEFGLEDKASLSQQTILLNYASNRVAYRGNVGAPDIIEKPGISLDIVARQGIRIGQDKQVELKFEARNITGTKHQEVQKTDAGELQSNVYKVGTSFSVGVGVKL